MYTFLAILAIVVSVLLILIVLIQNPKGGGLSSSFGGANQVMGVKKTTDFLEKATWTLAIALVLISVTMNLSTPGADESAIPQSEIQNKIDEAQGAPQAAPMAPAPVAVDSTK